MADHPIRSTALAEGGLVQGTLLDALLKRMPLTIAASEDLVDITQVSGSIPLAIVHAKTGQVFYYDDTDTTTVDDGTTCLVDGNGHRYKLNDSAAVSINSVLGLANTPPASPANGDAYVVDVAPTGAWVGRAKNVAIYTARGWIFATPQSGLCLLNEATGKNIQYDETGTWGGLEIDFAAGSILPAAQAFPMGLAVEAQQNAPPVSPTVGPHYLVGASGSGDWAGHSNDIAYLDSDGVTWLFFDAYDGATVYNKASLATLTYRSSSGTWSSPFSIAATCQARLTTVSATPITTTDQTAKATIYLTPFRGNGLSLYVNGGWSLRTLTEISLSLSGYTSGKPYDIFVYDNSGTPALESLVWTDDSTRATALALQDGIYVKSGDATRRYVGTIYTTATGQTEDSLAKRMVWNYYNRAERPMSKSESLGSWTYINTTLRQANNSSANQLDFVVGVAEDNVRATLSVTNYSSNGSGSAIAAIGLDSSTAAATAQVLNANTDRAVSSVSYSGIPAAGRHTLRWLEGVTNSSVGAGTYAASNSAITGAVRA